MLKIFKRGRIWYVRGTANGRSLYRSTGTDKRKLAEAKRTRWEAELYERGEHCTFAEATSLYLKAGGEETYMTAILDYLKDTQCDDITGAVVHAVANDLKPGCKNSTKNRHVVTPIRSVINHAANLGKCGYKKIPSFKIAKPQIPYATLEWFEGFFKHAPDNLTAYVITTALTGMRVSEAIRLHRKKTVEVFDWIDGQKAYLGKTKNGEAAVVHLPTEAVVAIANLPEYENGRVFGYTNRHSVNNAIRRTCEKAKIKNLSPHKCGRHTFATMYMTLGEGNLKGLMKEGRWKSINSLSGYVHLEQDDSTRKKLPLKRTGNVQ